MQESVPCMTPGTLKSLAAPTKLKPSRHRKGPGRYWPCVNMAGTWGRSGHINARQIDPSPPRWISSFFKSRTFFFRVSAETLEIRRIFF